MDRKEYKREWYKRRKALGLCVNCENKAVPGYTLCGICSYKKNIWQRDYYQRNHESLIVSSRKQRQVWLKEGKCYRCGAPLIEGESKYCFACMAGRHDPIRLMRGIANINRGVKK